MQQETSELHRQYLDSQQSAQRSIELLIQQQMRAGGVEPEVLETAATNMPIIPTSSPAVSTELKHATPILAPEITSPMPHVSEAVHSSSAGIVRGTLLDIVAEKTGYPREVLTPEMSLDKDLGIDSIKRVEIFSALSEHFPALAALSAVEAGSLDTLQQIEAHLVGPASENLVSSTVPAQLSTIQPTPVASTRKNIDLMTAIISVIADKTGYPTEALNPTMRMDEDLGIDSIKRVEIFSTLQERFPQALVVEPDAMARLRSIGDIIDHLGNGFVQPAYAKNGGNSNGNANANGNGAVPHFSREVSEPRRHVPYMSLPVGTGNLDRGLHRLVLKSTAVTLEKREAIHLPADAVIGILADGTNLGDALRHAFQQRGISSKLIHPDQKQAVGPLAGLLIVSPEQVCVDMLKRAFTVIREYGPQLQQVATHGQALLASVSRLNGRFGLGPDAIAQPLSAGLGGIIKTAAREWPQVHCKSIDISATWGNHQELADAIVSEVLLDGPLEVGLGQHGSTALELIPEALLPSDSGDRALLRREELVLVSGGARGISAAMAIALARHYQPTLVLLGRSPEPIAEPDWLQGVSGERAIKQAIHQHHDDAKSPKDIERLYRYAMANREILETLTTIEASGSKALYRSVDIRNHGDTTQALKELIAEHGPLRGIVHGAGILADSLITDKTDAQFASVLSTKCDGFINLLSCLNGQDPAFIVACSSTTARLGRKGQADYAAANECINKLAQKAARQYVGSKVLSVNWGPWDGGMVDARLKTIFKKEGVGLIPLDAGAEYLIQELQSGPSPAVELVVLGPTPGSVTPDPTPPLQLCYSLDVSLATMPILGSHVINARAVVPVSLIIEWLAHGALHASPGLRFVGLEDFRVFKGITFEASQCLKIRVLAGSADCVPTNQGRWEVIIVEVRSNDLLYARARIHLSEDYLTSLDSQSAVTHAPFSLEPYTDSSLFHGAGLQGITHVSGCDDQGISGETLTAPEPAVWLKNPLRSQWLADPLVLDASFQLMILWTEQFYSHGSLPTAIGRLELYAPFPATSVAIDIQLQNRQAHKATASIDFRNSQGCLIARIDEYECVIDVSLNAGFARNTFSSHS
jgi:NAD(P)-dependent dehydrogenase (short-subunit alcohol dehydrogenase family)/acyl carrier protein